jgi:hypothetical protein
LSAFKKPRLDILGEQFTSQSTMSEQSALNVCTCSKDGYSPECPKAFVQGGEILHALTGEQALKPRVYVGGDAEGSSVSRDGGFEREEGMIIRKLESMVTTDSRNYHDGDLEPRVRLGRDISMMERNRTNLRRFESLEVNGQSLTAMTIGGFVVDLSKAAQKASEVAPLPPSKLPVIFVDEEMNFYHHFFQGLEILLGRQVVTEIVKAGNYYSSNDGQLIAMIEKMIKVGYEQSDTEITVFTKKVITSTFETASQHGSSGTTNILIVAANLWGFQYIESGMQCKEADIGMWLSMCYNHYKTIWFNTFKSAGIPDFATQGVQTRYETRAPVYTSGGLSKSRISETYIGRNEGYGEADPGYRYRSRGHREERAARGKRNPLISMESEKKIKPRSFF